MPPLPSGEWRACGTALRTSYNKEWLVFFSMHTMDGDPQALLAAKRAHMDPVVARLAPQHGAIASITVPTETGIAVYNIWRDAAGAAAFTQEPEAQEAQQASGLPRPSSFARHPEAEVTIY